jgi:hypothetical protein
MNSFVKYILFSVLLMLISGCSFRERTETSTELYPLEIIVNPAIDLFSLMSRLAEINQYKELLLPDFIAEVESYFGPYRDHPGIAFARKCNAMHQINGDAPMALSVYVGPPPELKLRMDLSSIPPSFDPRWDSALISNYLAHARVFARDSRFMKFHHSTFEYLDQAKEHMYDMIGKEQIFQWYKSFFGYYPDRIKLYLALLNGSCSYGYPVYYPDGELEFVCLIGGRFPDNAGNPTYPKEWFLPIIIHEYMHAYINPLIKAKPKEFLELGEALLRTHRAKMIEHGYNVWNVIIQEYIVRACTIKYLEQAEGKRKAIKNLQRDLSDGFPDIQGLVRLMDVYELDRKTYPDIESFLPRIKAYFEDCASIN